MSPADERKDEPVRGLLSGDEDEPAAAVLGRVAWNGPVIDPDQLSAVEFLAALP